MSYQIWQDYLIDHLGNTRIAVNCDANDDLHIIQKNFYYPFGLSFTQGSLIGDENKFKYNGKELEDEHGLYWYHYGVRYYDPQLGRWHTMDPADEFQSPYLYVGNNPVKFIDPDGAQAYASQASSTYVNNWAKEAFTESRYNAGYNDYFKSFPENFPFKKGVSNFDYSKIDYSFNETMAGLTMSEKNEIHFKGKDGLVSGRIKMNFEEKVSIISLTISSQGYGKNGVTILDINAYWGSKSGVIGSLVYKTDYFLDYFGNDSANDINFNMGLQDAYQDYLSGKYDSFYENPPKK